MKTLKKKAGLKGIGTVRRSAVDVAADGLIEMNHLVADEILPLVIRPRLAGVTLKDWVIGNRDLIHQKLLQHGGILFRGFSANSVIEFEDLVKALSGGLLQYSYRSTPRSEVEGRIYTSTEYPPDQVIPMHNEMSYSRSWPRKIWFYSVKAAAQGGETPIADSRKVYQRIPPAVQDLFRDKGVMYVRNYGAGLDLPWQNVFNTDDAAEVERHCDAAGIEYEWRGGDRLRTRQTCAAIRQHPETGEALWFNQAHLFHVSSLRPELRQSLLEDLTEEELPRNAYYGDGTPIADADLAEIRRAFDEVEVAFPWEEGDLLLLDNMLTAHGRRPFEGQRKVLVGMAEEATAAN